jgi:hypothetical protein
MTVKEKLEKIEADVEDLRTDEIRGVLHEAARTWRGNGESDGKEG